MESVLAIIGPSAAGKSTIAQELQRQGLIKLTPTVTDRPRRSGEAAIEHAFVSPAEFDARAAAGDFLEVVQPFQLPYRYGAPPIRACPGRVPALMLRVEFLSLLLRHYPDHKVYQIEAPKELVARRLGRRLTDPGTRLEQYQREVEAGRARADRRFVNDSPSIDPAVAAIRRALAEDFQPAG